MTPAERQAKRRRLVAEKLKKADEVLKRGESADRLKGEIEKLESRIEKADAAGFEQMRLAYLRGAVEAAAVAAPRQALFILRNFYLNYEKCEAVSKSCWPFCVSGPDYDVLSAIVNKKVFGGDGELVTER
jgi:hypothetical protein